MNIIQQVRSEREELAHVLKKHSGIRRIVEDLYPDSAHFIYELLQNAEDTGATEARFQLTQADLIFEHNGRSFTHDDLLGITDIGEGTKAADDDKIGRFGVGFKSVFAYSETPHVWSPTYNFKITDLVLPSELEALPRQNGTTRFRFPFNNPKKDPSTAYAEVEAGLRGLAETTLLFLSNLESICWKIAEGSESELLRIQHSPHHFEVLKRSGGSTTTSAHFLKFEQPVASLEGRRVAVAFALDLLPGLTHYQVGGPLAKQLKIIPAMPGHVSVFFPAEKEASGLRFHLHAPFIPELSRASIKETPKNEPLFDQLAALTAASLHRVRDLGLLTVEFLSTLPNPQDQIPNRYERIRTAIVQEMNTQPLTPTQAHAYAPAKHLLQARAVLKELLTPEDLAFLIPFDEELPRWAASAQQKNSNADRFLSGLAITEWDIEHFVAHISTALTDCTRSIPRPPYLIKGPDAEALAWIASHDLAWHQKLYSLLSSELSSVGGQSRLIKSRIVRLTDGSYTTGSRCFFPGEEDEDDKVLPRVAVGTFTSGRARTQQENAKRFLEAIGVRVVREKEQVEAILKQRYQLASFSPRKADLRRFISLVEKDPSSAVLFADYFIFERRNGDWGTPSHVYLDEPILSTGLHAYYLALGDKANRAPLAERYAASSTTAARFAKFASAVGVQTLLQPVKVGCSANPQWTYLRTAPGSRHTSSATNTDYAIPHLEEILRKPNISVSRLVWKTMCSLHDGYLEAKFGHNRSSGYYYADSQIVHHLRTAPWVPQRDGTFVTPHAASRELLPDGFAFDPGWKWIKLLHFGADAVRKTEAHRQKQAMAKELGFPDRESLERAVLFSALPPEEQERILSARSSSIEPAELPEHEPRNRAGRRERVIENAAAAPERMTEERIRSVARGLGRIKEEAAAYLREQYTNLDGATICQICKSPLPFKLTDGKYYFEKVEFLRTLKKHHYQNYLALCPNHAAMFQHANGSTERMHRQFAELSGNELTIVLAEDAAAVYFTKTHIADMRAVIVADAQMASEDDNGNALASEIVQQVLEDAGVV